MSAAHTAPHPCQRCGSEEWTDVDYSGCSECRELCDDRSNPFPDGPTDVEPAVETLELADAGLLAKPPQPVLDALAEWLEHERPDGVEVSSEQVDRNVRWSVVRQWFEAAGGTL